MIIRTYDDSLTNFGILEALKFVKDHRNFLDERTTRNTFYNEQGLIIIKEVGLFQGKTRIWLWGFSRIKRTILKLHEGETMPKNTIIEIIKGTLLEDEQEK